MKIYEDKYIVITGGAGFIGSCLIKYLNESGLKNIVVVDELGKTEKWKNLVGKRIVEIVPKDTLFQWLVGRENDIEAFIHLGACSSTTETDASFLLENNTRFSIRLVEYALTHDHRFIYASSAATYGDGSQGFSDDHEMLDELRPLNMYGFSKHLFDLWLKDNHLLDKVVGLKYFNIFGPNEYHKGRMASPVLKMVPEVLESGKVHLFKSSEPTKFGDGEQKRDFLYVKDAVKMTALFLTNDKNGIFNIGMGKSHTWNQLAEFVMKALHKPVNIEYIDMPSDLIGKYQNYTLADMNKFFQTTGYEVAFSFEKAVYDYITNYLSPHKYW